MHLRDDLELRKLIEEDLINSMQEKRSKLCDRAKNAIEKILHENRINYDRKRKKVSLYRVGDLITIK